MGKEVSFKNRDRFIQLGIAISTLRRIRGLSQEKLAEKAGIAVHCLVLSKPPTLPTAFLWKYFLTLQTHWTLIPPIC